MKSRVIDAVNFGGLNFKKHGEKTCDLVITFTNGDIYKYSRVKWEDTVNVFTPYGISLIEKRYSFTKVSNPHTVILENDYPEQFNRLNKYFSLTRLDKMSLFSILWDAKDGKSLTISQLWYVDMLNILHITKGNYRFKLCRTYRQAQFACIQYLAENKVTFDQFTDSLSALVSSLTESLGYEG